MQSRRKLIENNGGDEILSCGLLFARISAELKGIIRAARWLSTVNLGKLAIRRYGDTIVRYFPPYLLPSSLSLFLSASLSLSYIRERIAA